MSEGDGVASGFRVEREKRARVITVENTAGSFKRKRDDKGSGVRVETSTRAPVRISPV